MSDWLAGLRDSASLRWADWLAGFRENEPPEVVLVMDASPGLQRFLAAWATIHGHIHLHCAPGSVGMEWDELWSCVTVDLDAVATRMGKRVEVAHDHFRQAVALRLIYPDGGMHEGARALLRKRADTLTSRE